MITDLYQRFLFLWRLSAHYRGPNVSLPFANVSYQLYIKQLNMPYNPITSNDLNGALLIIIIIAGRLQKQNYYF